VTSSPCQQGLGTRPPASSSHRTHRLPWGAPPRTRSSGRSGLGWFVQLDVTDDASVEAALAVLDEREGHLESRDNAGISTSDVTGRWRWGLDTTRSGHPRHPGRLPLLRSREPGRGQMSRTPRLFLGVTNRSASVPLPHHVRRQKAAVSSSTVAVRQNSRNQVQCRQPVHGDELTSLQRSRQPSRRARGHCPYGDHRPGVPPALSRGRARTRW